MSANIKTQGTLFQVEKAASPNEYTTMTGVKSITGLGGGEATDIDVTDMDSTAMEYLQGLPDEGNLTVSGNYDPDNAQQIQCEDARDAQSSLNFQVQLVSGTLKYFRFTAFVKSFDKSMDANGVVSFTMNLRITGSVTKASS